MNSVHKLLSRGFKFQDIANAANLDVVTIYKSYLSKEIHPMIDKVLIFYDHTGRLPNGGDLAISTRTTLSS